MLIQGSNVINSVKVSPIMKLKYKEILEIFFENKTSL